MWLIGAELLVSCGAMASSESFLFTPSEFPFSNCSFFEILISAYEGEGGSVVTKGRWYFVSGNKKTVLIIDRPSRPVFNHQKLATLIFEAIGPEIMGPI